jgi:hypothetical protein
MSGVIDAAANCRYDICWIDDLPLQARPRKTMPCIYLNEGKDRKGNFIDPSNNADAYSVIE